METTISGLVLSQIGGPTRSVEPPLMFAGVRCVRTSSSCFPGLVQTERECGEEDTGKRPAASVAVTTTTSGPSLFTAHLSSARAKFGSRCRWRPALRGGPPRADGGRYPSTAYSPVGPQVGTSGGRR